MRTSVGEYLDWLDRHRKSGKDARSRAEALILPRLGDKVCAESTAKDIAKWRDGLADQAPRLRTRTGQAQQYRQVDEVDDEAIRRRKATANRTLTILKAALNAAWRDGKIASDNAWRRVGPFKEADAARVRYLSIDESRRLINAAQNEFRDLVRAALATGCCYGELAALRVCDFNPDSGTVQFDAEPACDQSGEQRDPLVIQYDMTILTSLARSNTGRSRARLKRALTGLRSEI